MGISLDVSSDGSVLAIGGYVSYGLEIFRYNGKWQKLGQEIMGSFGSYFDLSLSSSGSILVLTYHSIVRILTFDEVMNQWLDIMTSFPTVNYTGVWLPSIATSADATKIFVAADTTVDYYELEILDTKSDVCSESEYAFNFTILPDQFPDDIIWFLKNNRGETLIGGRLMDRKNHEQQSHKLHFLRCIEKSNAYYTFHIDDYYGDGICCDWGVGYFIVEWDTKHVLGSNGFESTKSVRLPQSVNLAVIEIKINFFPSTMVFLLQDTKNEILMQENGIDDFPDKDTTYYQ